MAKGSCKCKAAACEECPEWIFTFADLVMLMMGFFVILWVLKPGMEPKKEDAKSASAQEQWLDTVAEIRGGFGWEPNPNSTDPVDVAARRKRERMGEGKGGKTEKSPQGAVGNEPEVQSIRPGKHAIVGTRVLFEAGKTELPADAATALAQIVGVIKGHRQIFVVKGHTALDDFVEGATAEQKMNLSVLRAQRVADYLTGHGVEPDILRVQGCSTFEPVVLRAYTEDARVLNRRVEVEGTDSPVSERQDAAKTTTLYAPDARESTVDKGTKEDVHGVLPRNHGGADERTATLPTETIEHP